MDITLFIVPMVLWVLALVISTGKANFLIAGYNTASQKEKEKDKIDDKKLSKFMGKFLFILGSIQLVIPIVRILKVDKFNFILMWTNIIFVIITIGGVIYMNTGKRFEK